MNPIEQQMIETIEKKLLSTMVHAAAECGMIPSEFVACWQIAINRATGCVTKPQPGQKHQGV